MKKLKAGAALMAVAMIAGIFSGCTKTANITTEKFAQICDKMGLEEYDFEGEMPKPKDVEKGYYLIADEKEAEDYLDDNFGERLDEFASSFGFEGIIDTDTVKSFAFAAKCEGYKDFKNDFRLDKPGDAELDGAFAIQMTLDGNHAGEFMESITDLADDYGISLEDLTDKEFYSSEKESYLRIHLDLTQVAGLAMDNDDLTKIINAGMSDDLEDLIGGITGDVALSIEVNGPNVLIVGGGSFNEEPAVLRDFIKAFGLSSDPLKLPMNEAFVSGLIEVCTDTVKSYMDMTVRNSKDHDPDTDPGTDPTGETTIETTAETTAVSASVKVGVSLPTKDLRRWNQDGDLMRKELMDEGYEVDLQYASNDTNTQARQISAMVDSGCKVIIVAAISPDSLNQVLQNAKDNGVTVIAYDRVINGTDAVDYLVTFDNYMVGQIQGKYIEAMLDLGRPEGLYTMEITSGDPSDINGMLFYNGAMDVLKPYIDSGKLQIKSGQIDYDATATEGWSTDKAWGRAESIIGKFYSGSTTLDAWLCLNDSTALGVAKALETAYTGRYPIVTGQDCEIENVKNIINGKQSMSVFKDTRTLVERTVKMTTQIVEGKTVEVNNTETYNNGVKTLPAYLCEPVFVTKDNYKEILIDSGYYTADMFG